jgi:hypothetical protein
MIIGHQVLMKRTKHLFYLFVGSVPFIREYG